MIPEPPSGQNPIGSNTPANPPQAAPAGGQSPRLEAGRHRQFHPAQVLAHHPDRSPAQMPALVIFQAVHRRLAGGQYHPRHPAARLFR